MKETFINNLNKTLSDFTKCTDTIYTKEIQKHLPGQIMIINNQQIQQPGQTINLKFKFEIFGDGSVDDEECIIIHFSIYQNGENKIRELFDSFYYNEIDRFNETFKQFYQI